MQRDAKAQSDVSAVRFVKTRARGVPSARSRFPRKAVACLAFAALIAGSLLHALPPDVLLAYAVMSSIAVFVYAFDKSAAVRGGWRTQEGTLHLVALLGGWPGALLAQDLFRHKSRKVEFQVVFWITVFVNVVGLVWVLRSGALRG